MLDRFSIDAGLIRRRESEHVRGQTARLPHQVLGQEERRGTGTADRHRLKRLAHHGVNLLTMPDGAAPLGDGPEDGLEVNLVVIAALAVKVGRVDLPGEQEQGDGVCPGLGHPRQRIGRPWTGRGANDSRPRGDPGVAIGHECPGLLVAGQDRGDRAGSRQGVVDCGGMRSGHAKDVFDAVESRAFPPDDPRQSWCRMIAWIDHRDPRIGAMASCRRLKPGRDSMPPYTRAPLESLAC